VDHVVGPMSRTPGRLGGHREPVPLDVLHGLPTSDLRSLSHWLRFPSSGPGKLCLRMLVDPSDVVVIGASAGGVEALSEFVAHLWPRSKRAFFVALHMPGASTSVLPRPLQTSSALPVAFATDGGAIRSGAVTIAPPGSHMLLTGGTTRLVIGPRENGHRPAIDPLFRSGATVFGPVTGVLLSGSLDDGVAGLAAIKAAGGRVLVQDPEEALHPW